MGLARPKDETGQGRTVCCWDEELAVCWLL
uniref:Uncharacterized protein n=1 Tax=Anguilla anguilla TaxID=7936 RepID=A0A0E9QG91_ANGAN